MRVVLLALACVCLVIVLVLWRGIRAEPRAAVVAKADPAPTPAVRRTSAPPPRLEPPRRRARAKRETAHVRGRLVGPADVSASALIADLVVTAEEGDRRYEASLEEDATFALHVPAGAYRLVAIGSEWVGEASVVAVGGATVEVTVVLGAAAKITGTVKAPDLSQAVVTIAGPPSARTRTRSIEDDGSFEIAGLVAGEAYELTFSAGDAREKTLTVTAPREALEVTLEPLPVLEGAIGYDPAEGCQIDEVEISDGAKFTASADVDDECRFTIAGLPAARELTISADGGGWHFTDQILTAAEGNPPPLCLNPPCAERAAKATVVVEAIDARSGADLSLVVHSERGTWPCRDQGPRCAVQVPVGAKVTAHARNLDCAADAPPSITVRPGTNRIALQCHPMRIIQGVLRYPAPPGATPPPFSVRCAGSSETANTRGYLFQLHCPVETSAVEFRSIHEPLWRQARLPTGAGTVLVEIGL
jgi:hypothetical protein